MKRILSVWIAFVLLVGGVFSASASGYSVNSYLTVNGRNVYDLNTVVGYNDIADVLGLDLSGIAGGEIINLILRAGKERLILSDGLESRTIDYRTLGEALLSELLSRMDGETAAVFLSILAAARYITDGGAESDLPMIEAWLSREANRLSYTAQQAGILTLDAAGNITLSANAADAVRFFKAYLISLAADDESFRMLSDLHLLSVSGITGAEINDLREDIADLADDLDPDEVYADEFSLYLAIRTDGSTELRLSGGDTNDSLFSLQASSGADGLSFRLDETEQNNYETLNTSVSGTCSDGRLQLHLGIDDGNDEQVLCDIDIACQNGVYSFAYETSQGSSYWTDSRRMSISIDPANRALRYENAQDLNNIDGLYESHSMASLSFDPENGLDYLVMIDEDEFAHVTAKQEAPDRYRLCVDAVIDDTQINVIDALLETGSSPRFTLHERDMKYDYSAEAYGEPYPYLDAEGSFDPASGRLSAYVTLSPQLLEEIDPYEDYTRSVTLNLNGTVKKEQLSLTLDLEGQELAEVSASYANGLLNALKQGTVSVTLSVPNAREEITLERAVSVSGSKRAVTWTLSDNDESLEVSAELDRSSNRVRLSLKMPSGEKVTLSTGCADGNFHLILNGPFIYYADIDYDYYGYYTTVYDRSDYRSDVRILEIDGRNFNLMPMNPLTLKVSVADPYSTDPISFNFRLNPVSYRLTASLFGYQLDGSSDSDERYTLTLSRNGRSVAGVRFDMGAYDSPIEALLLSNFTADADDVIVTRTVRETADGYDITFTAKEDGELILSATLSAGLKRQNGGGLLRLSLRNDLTGEAYGGRIDYRESGNGISLQANADHTLRNGGNEAILDFSAQINDGGTLSPVPDGSVSEEEALEFHRALAYSLFELMQELF